MNSVTEITDSQFESEVLKPERLVLIYFWAPWCGPCKLLSPSVNWVAEAYAEKLKVVKMEIDPNPETVARYKIEGVPALVLLRQGEVLAQTEGAIGKQKVEELITAHL